MWSLLGCILSFHMLAWPLLVSCTVSSKSCGRCLDAGFQAPKFAFFLFLFCSYVFQGPEGDVEYNYLWEWSTFTREFQIHTISKEIYRHLPSSSSTFTLVSEHKIDCVYPVMLVHIKILHNYFQCSGALKQVLKSLMSWSFSSTTCTFVSLLWKLF